MLTTEDVIKTNRPDGSSKSNQQRINEYVERKLRANKNASTTPCLKKREERAAERRAEEQKMLEKQREMLKEELRREIAEEQKAVAAKPKRTSTRKAATSE